jgi:hypothetical protein
MFHLIERGHEFGMSDLTRYLLVRDSDGAILAEFDSPESTLRALLRYADFRGPGLSLVKFHEHAGEIVGTSSLVTVRPGNFDITPSRVSIGSSQSRSIRSRVRPAPARRVRR